ncbi:hypothetical protein [Bradyrhizobium japonicum]|uniref:hypothetical protein n=1 Tax=Bradyrhizobium japonicum TaxID=375 RepID=UPI0021680FB8|nr:hypothetical protein [Bradyrhizobium japonicum]
MPSAITDAASGRAQTSPKSETRRRGYFTTRSSGRRGWSCVCLEGGLRFASSAPQHFVAQRLEIGTVNSFELHPHVEDDDGQQLGRLAVVALVENLAALLKRFQHRLQLFV